MNTDSSFIIFRVFKEAQFKGLLAVLILVAAVVEFTGMGLVYPFIHILLGMNAENNKIVSTILETISSLGIPTSRNWLLLYIFLLIATKAALLAAYTAVGAVSTMRYKVGLQKTIFKRVFASPYGKISTQLSRITNAITTQTNQAASSLLVSFRLTQGIILLLSLVTIGLMLSWKIFLTATLLGCLLAGILFSSVRYAGYLGSKLTKYNESLLGDITQAVGNIRYLKAVEAYSPFLHRLKPLLSRIYRTQVGYTLVNRGTGLMTEPLTVGMLVAIFVIGGVLQENTETLLVQLILLQRIMGQGMTLLTSFQSYRNTLPGCRYCYNILEELEAEPDSSAHKNFTPEDGGLTLEYLSYAYESDKGDSPDVLKDISLDIPRNSLAVFYGESGSGKTTLLNILTGLLRPTKGSIIAGGTPLEETNMLSYRKRIGLVSQDNVLFNLSLRDNLKFRNPEATDEEIIHHMKLFGLEKLCGKEGQGLDTIVDENMSNLSGGQRQRLTIIRELLTKPSILILDEPTSALDEESKNTILKYLEKLKGTMTIIVVTHNMDFIKLADESWNLQAGVATKS
ncbi:MAG: ATP-binding cassette domain-containing protein [Desulfovibrio sp.]